MSGTLYILATPIGNLGDISTRALEIFRNCDYLVSENPTTTLKLLSKYEIRKTVRSYREENHERTSNQIIEDVKAGKNIGVVSEAGTPLVSDPGAKLLRVAYENEIKVIPIPGASAVSTAASVFPLTGTKFIFWGFAPRKEGEFRRMIIDNLEILIKEKMSIIVFESPFRLKKSLGFLAKIEQEFTSKFELKVGLGKEMTKIHEAYVYDTPSGILARENKDFMLDKGEATLVITIKKRQNGVDE